MTSPDHPSGTDRCYEALTVGRDRFDAVVNIQGDGAYHAGAVDQLCAALREAEGGIATLAQVVTDEYNGLEQSPEKCSSPRMRT